MPSGKNLNYQIPKIGTGKLKTLTEPRHEKQVEFSGQLNNKKTKQRIPTVKSGRQI